MPDWDEDSPRLSKNLAQVLGEIRRSAKQRKTPGVEAAREWQRVFMQGLNVADAKYVGSFRGEPGLENVQVRVGSHYGVPPGKVAEELRNFEAKLQETTALLDRMVPAGGLPTVDQLEAVLDFCAWAHAEWVRIHPFANGNGRTARLWANSIALRYGLPPFIRLRPRPDGEYGTASAEAMQGNWEPTATVLREMLNGLLDEVASEKDAPKRRSP